MRPAWQAMIKDAQRDKTVLYRGKEYYRIAYGQETWIGPWPDGLPERCRDCAVAPGQLHVNTCDVEQCPICANQRLGCEKHWWKAELLSIAAI